MKEVEIDRSSSSLATQFLLDSPNAAQMMMPGKSPKLQRAISISSAVSLRESSNNRRMTTTFGDFLSDDSSSDEDDDGQTLQRMQEQADDMDCLDMTTYQLDSPNTRRSVPSEEPFADHNSEEQSFMHHEEDDSGGEGDEESEGDDVAEDDGDLSFRLDGANIRGFTDEEGQESFAEARGDDSFRSYNSNDDSFVEGANDSFISDRLRRSEDSVDNSFVEGRANDSFFSERSRMSTDSVDDTFVRGAATHESFIDDGPRRSDDSNVEDSFVGDVNDSFISDRPRESDDSIDNSFVGGPGDDNVTGDTSPRASDDDNDRAAGNSLVDGENENSFLGQRRSFDIEENSFMGNQSRQRESSISKSSFTQENEHNDQRRSTDSVNHSYYDADNSFIDDDQERESYNSVDDSFIGAQSSFIKDKSPINADDDSFVGINKSDIEAQDRRGSDHDADSPRANSFLDESAGFIKTGCDDFHQFTEAIDTSFQMDKHDHGNYEQEDGNFIHEAYQQHTNHNDLNSPAIPDNDTSEQQKNVESVTCANDSGDEERISTVSGSPDPSFKVANVDSWLRNKSHSVIDFMEANYQFEEEGGHEMIGEMDQNERLSADSLASSMQSSVASSFADHKFFVGSDRGSDAESLSYTDYAGSESFSSVAMLEDDLSLSQVGSEKQSIQLEEKPLVKKQGTTDASLVSTSAGLPTAAKSLVTSDNSDSLNASGVALRPSSNKVKQNLAASQISSSSSESGEVASRYLSTSSDDLSFVSLDMVRKENTTNISTESSEIPPLVNSTAISDESDALERKSGKYGASTSLEPSTVVTDTMKYINIPAPTISRLTHFTPVTNAEAIPSGEHAIEPISSPSLTSLDEDVTVRTTDGSLDFTGVYRGSINSLNASAHRHEAKAAQQPDTKVATSKNATITAETLGFLAPPVPLGRTLSAQRVSERKVADFFRQSYKYGDDDVDLQHGRSRARTTVVNSVREEEEGNANEFTASATSRLRRVQSVGGAKLIDLKSFKKGDQGLNQFQTGEAVTVNTHTHATSGSGHRITINEDLLSVPDSPRNSNMSFGSHSESRSSSEESHDELNISEQFRPSRDAPHQSRRSSQTVASSRAIQYNYRPSVLGSSDTGDSITASSEDSPNMIPMPPHYMLSPKMHLDQNPNNRSGFFSVFQAQQAMPNSATKDARPTPTLPGLAPSPAGPSPLISSFISSKGPVGGNTTPGLTTGFKWHYDHDVSDDGGMSIKSSIWHEAGINRPTLSHQIANHIQSLSSSLSSTLRRAGMRLFGQNNRSNQTGVTSPQSTCSAPPTLPRAFDDRHFYVRFGRGGGVQVNGEALDVKQGLRQPHTEHLMEKHRARFLMVLGAAILGIVIGIILIQVGGTADAFVLSNTEQHDRQSINGELVLAAATRWILLPGKLFLRCWNCVTMPLLFCQVVNGVADLVMGGKMPWIFSFSTACYVFVIALLATLEGVGTVALFRHFGLFGGSTTEKLSVINSASMLKATLGVSVGMNGTVAMMCDSEQTYLQLADSTDDSFICSNESIALPVYLGANTTATIIGSSAAIFSLTDVNDILAKNPGTNSSSESVYYPVGMRFEDMANDFTNAIVPDNFVEAFADSMSLSVVTFALLLGFVCGKRVLQRESGITGKPQEAATGNSVSGDPSILDHHNKPHYMLGVTVELQLALEWIVSGLETIAPIGVASLLAGSIVLHYEEWRVFLRPMMQLVLGVLGVCVLHMVIVIPIMMKLWFKVNTLAFIGDFLPAFLFCFCTDSIVLSLPVVAHCCEKAQVVSKSCAQMVAAVTSVLLRTGQALYYPLALFWLLETNNLEALDLSAGFYAVLGGFGLLSCFVPTQSSTASLVKIGPTTGNGNLVILMTFYRAFMVHEGKSDYATTMLPTMSLLVICHVIISRLIAIVSLHDHIILMRMVAEYAHETVVQFHDDTALVAAEASDPNWI